MMVCWSGWGVGVAIISRVLKLDGVEPALHMRPSGHDGSFGILPQFFGGEHSGRCYDVVAYDAIVRVVRETFQIESVTVFILLRLAHLVVGINIVS